MKTFDEAVEKVIPAGTEFPVDWAQKFRTQYQTQEVAKSAALVDEAQRLAVKVIDECLCCQEHAYQGIRAVALSCLEIGIAIGIEMEKQEL